MTRAELEAMPARELDAVVAEKVLGWDCSHAYVRKFLVPSVSTDDNAARMMRDRIAELGLEHSFVLALWVPANIPYTKQLFELWQSTPRQQAIAAVLVVEEGLCGKRI